MRSSSKDNDDTGTAVMKPNLFEEILAAAAFLLIAVGLPTMPFWMP